MAFAQLSINVLDHDDRAVDDDSEIDCADGKKVGCFACLVQEDESKQERQRNSEGGDDCSPNADQEKDEDDEDKDHAANEVPFDGIRGDAHKITAVVVGTDLYVGRKNVLV